jgi:hypothetical protein
MQTTERANPIYCASMSLRKTKKKRTYLSADDLIRTEETAILISAYFIQASPVFFNERAWQVFDEISFIRNCFFVEISFVTPHSAFGDTD